MTVKSVDRSDPKTPSKANERSEGVFRLLNSQPSAASPMASRVVFDRKEVTDVGFSNLVDISLVCPYAYFQPVRPASLLCVY